MPMTPPTPLSITLSAWKHFDRDDNGSISYHELALGLQYWGLDDGAGVEPRALAAALDANGDGQITFTEANNIIITKHKKLENKSRTKINEAMYESR